MATDIILIRHGETEWNHLRRIQGQLDIPLNAIGMRQAQAVAWRLAPPPADRPAQRLAEPPTPASAKLRIDAVYTSDLKRASDTAAPIAAAHGLVAQPDPRLRERHYGGFQGSYYDQLQHTVPDVYRRMLSRDLSFDLDGGETIPMLYRRVSEALLDLASRHRDATIVVVTHGGVLDCCYRLATGLDLDAPRAFGLFNAGLNRIALDERGFRLVSWGDVEHLAGAADEIDPRARPAAPVGKVG
jgi:probable phosphoglycerate mutase